MKYDCCLSCNHCDPARKNGLGEVRCKRFSTYVSATYKCDYHSSKDIAEELKMYRSGIHYTCSHELKNRKKE